MKFKYTFILFIIFSLNFSVFAENINSTTQFDELIIEIDKISWSKEKIKQKLSEDLEGKEEEAFTYYISKIKQIFSHYDNHIEDIYSEFELKNSNEIRVITKILENYPDLLNKKAVDDIFSTKNPYYKAHLLQLAFDFTEDKGVFYPLLDDKTICRRTNRLSQSIPQRICDLVYLLFLKDYPTSKYPELDYKIYKYSYKERDVLINKLKEIIESQVATNQPPEVNP